MIFKIRNEDDAFLQTAAAARGVVGHAGLFMATSHTAAAVSPLPFSSLVEKPLENLGCRCWDALVSGVAVLALIDGGVC